ncbi:hypothetical protein P4S70_15395 [Enterovibrio sp. Hal110]
MLEEAEKPKNDDNAINYDYLDSFLTDLLRNLETHDFESSITCTVGGSLVSGTMISGKKYFTTLNESSGATDGEINLFVRMAEFYDKQPPESLTYFLHLRDVTFFQSSKLVKCQLYRLKVSDISGFTLGSIRAD